MTPDDSPDPANAPAEAGMEPAQFVLSLTDRIRTYQALADTLGPVDPDFDMKTFCDGL